MAHLCWLFVPKWSCPRRLHIAVVVIEMARLLKALTPLLAARPPSVLVTRAKSIEQQPRVAGYCLLY